MNAASLFTDEQLTELGAKLQRLRSALISTKKPMQEEGLKELVPSRLDEVHPSDLASGTATQEALSEVVAVETREIQEIEEALQRIRKDEYGFCESCGQVIRFERLRALPETRFCQACSALGNQRKARGAPIDLKKMPTLDLETIPGIKDKPGFKLPRLMRKLDT